MREDGLVDTLCFEGQGKPLGGLAEIEGDWCCGGWDDAAWGCGVRGGKPCGVRRDAAPADDACKAKIVEPAGVVVGDTHWEDCALPLDGGSFEAFELLNRCEDAFFAFELRCSREMVPIEEPAHEDVGSDRFNLLAQRAERETMDALQDATLAPFDGVGFFR